MASANQNATRIANDNYAKLLGVELVHAADDHVVMKLPYSPSLGVGRIHGGAISSLIDVAATAAFWSTPTIGPQFARCDGRIHHQLSEPCCCH